jgi:hypothetical protein
MTGGTALSERERERERARKQAGLAVLLGRASRPREEKERALLGRAGREEEKRPELQFLFFFFKNMNSDSFCLFQ